MTFSTEIQHRSSYRDSLVRIAVRRNMTTLLIGIVGGNGDNYFWTAPPGPVLSVSRNGSALTRVAMTAAESADSILSNDEYAVVVANSGEIQLWVNLADAPSSSSNVIIAEYALCYATDKVRTTVDPEDSETDLVRWEPRLSNSPEVGSYIDNILAGVLSFDDTSIEIADADNVFKDFLTINDSMRSSRVEIWAWVNSANVRKIYRGEVSGLERSGGNMVVSVVDITNRLRQPAYMGDTASKCFWNRESGSFPDTNPADNGKPIKMILGSFSRHNFSPIKYLQWGMNGIQHSVLSDCEEAVCTSFSQFTQNNRNRTWGLCRVKNGITKPANLPSPISFLDITYIQRGHGSTVVGGSLFASVGATAFNALSPAPEPGDSYQFAQSGKPTTYGVLIHINNVSDPDNYILHFLINRTTTPGYDGNVTATSQKITAYIEDLDGNKRFVFEGGDFTRNETALASGNTYVSLTFSNGFEDNYDEIEVLDPSIHKVYFRVRPITTAMNHSDVLKDICESAGLSVNAASFAAAKTALAVDTYFSIPTSREDSFNEYLKYAEQICKSTMAYLVGNSDGEMVYKLVEAPSGGDPINENTSRLNSYSVNYNDIVTGLIGVNQDLRFDGDNSLESSEAEYLHNLKNVVRFYHVLFDISSRLPDILAIMRQRKVIYSHSVPHIALEREIGDQLTIENDEVMGGSGSVDVFITGIRKTMDGTIIETTDLGAGS